MNSRIVEDPRTISGIYFDDDEGSCYQQSDGFIIIAYAEPGPVGPIPWLEISKDGQVVARLTAYKVRIVYA